MCCGASRRLQLRILADETLIWHIQLPAALEPVLLDEELQRSVQRRLERLQLRHVALEKPQRLLVQLECVHMHHMRGGGGTNIPGCIVMPAGVVTIGKNRWMVFSTIICS